MTVCRSGGKTKNLGFISTRFSGTDGVSLETEKWAHVLTEQGFKCYYFAGELDRDPRISYLAEEAHFSHPDVRDIYRSCFGVSRRNREISQRIHEMTRLLKDHLYRFIEMFEIGSFITENALTIPMNIPLGIAITEVISETEMPTIAHHHDFFWERSEFLKNAIWDYLNMAFPPHLPSIKHVVINSSQDNQLSLRSGISSTLIPNVMDFDNPPAQMDEYASDVRQSLGIEEDTVFVLQPTRVVKRKGIEHAIELVQRLDMKAKLVVSHASGDEGYGYEKRIRQYSEMMNVDSLFVSETINDRRGTTSGGSKVYCLDDIYHHADLITYPSLIEGFGNAFLEAIYFRRPIVVNTYSIFEMDIKPKGFSVIEINGYVTDDAIDKTRNILRNPELRNDMAEKNYGLAKQYYSYTVLERRLQMLLTDL